MLKNAANAAVSQSIDSNSTSNDNTNIEENVSTNSTSSATQATATLDTLIQRMQGLKRKLESLHDEERNLHVASRRRIEHLQSLYEIKSLADVKYESWSKIRLARLLVDYLLRGGYDESARALAKAKGIEDMVDVDAFVQCHRVEESLKKGRTVEGLSWCNENKQALKKINVCLPFDKFLRLRSTLLTSQQSTLEYELRLQQCIELIRSGDMQKVAEAASHAKKYLSGHQDANFAVRAAGLLAYPPDTWAQPYRVSSKILSHYTMRRIKS